MRAKKRTLIITFDTTTKAIAMERLCRERQLPGRLIPVPREITAGCGLAWKAPPEEEGSFTQALNDSGLLGAVMCVLEL